MRQEIRRTAMLALLWPLVAAAADAPTASFAFETHSEGFAAAGGRGTVRWDKPTAPARDGRITLELAAKAREFRLASPAFAVRPWTIYRVTVQRTVDRGAMLEVLLRLKCGESWQEVRPTRAGGARLFGAWPGVTQAKVELVLRVPGRAIGRSARVRSVGVVEHARGVGRAGINLYWDGSFEREPSAPPCGWSFWVTQPEEVGYATRSPRHGRRCYRVRSKRTYVVFASVPVRPGRLYRLRYWVRGTGAIYPGLHKLSPADRGAMRLDTAVRVGWASPAVGEVRLKRDAWQAVEILTFCEDARVAWFQPYFSLAGTVEIDDVDLRAVERPPATRPATCRP